MGSKRRKIKKQPALIICILIILIFLAPFQYPQEESFEQLFNKLQKADALSQKVIVNQIITKYLAEDSSVGKIYAENLLKITSNFKDSYSYILTSFLIVGLVPGLRKSKKSILHFN